MQRIKKGDKVEIIAGKDKGQQGEVVTVMSQSDRLVISGKNVMKRHQKARQLGGQQIPAQIVEFDAPLHLSNVMLVCPSCSETTRIGFRFTDAGRKVRFCKKCNANFE